MGVGASTSIELISVQIVSSMGIDAGLCMYDVVVKKFTFASSSPDEFLVGKGWGQDFPTCSYMSGSRHVYIALAKQSASIALHYQDM